MKPQLWPSEPGVRVSRAYDRLIAAQRPSRAVRRELRDLHNLAFAAQQAALAAKPRLVAVPKPLRVIALTDFLATAPAVDVVAIELATPKVARFDKREVIASQVEL